VGANGVCLYWAGEVGDGPLCGSLKLKTKEKKILGPPSISGVRLGHVAS